MRIIYVEKRMDGILCLNQHTQHDDHEILGYSIHENPFCEIAHRSFWCRFLCNLIWPLAFCRCIMTCCDTYQQPIYRHREQCEQCKKFQQEITNSEATDLRLVKIGDEQVVFRK